jgi:chromosomal replication initiation ATPase DnaA
MIDLEFSTHLCKKYSLDLQAEIKEFKELNITNIESEILKYCNLLNADYRQIVSKTRKREIAQVRQVIMWKLYSTKLYTLKQIGDNFGGRDHSSVINSRNVVNDYIAIKDKLFLSMTEKVMSV